jgi:GH15 family glucan-1,4-alpha-glucosidase
MAWVAFDRGIKAVETFDLDGPVDRWRCIRAEIHEEVCRRAYNTDLGSFAQAYDSDLLDASALLIPQVGFLPPEDARVRTQPFNLADHIAVSGRWRESVEEVRAHARLLPMTMAAAQAFYAARRNAALTAVQSNDPPRRLSYPA